MPLDQWIAYFDEVDSGRGRGPCDIARPVEIRYIQCYLDGASVP
jgi:hypothetical protein